MLNEEIKNSDPNHEFVQMIEFVTPSEMPKLLSGSDISIFASSCENLPVTLLESMGVGLPIASSNLGPMPEVLKDAGYHTIISGKWHVAGVYFDPKDYTSIELAIEKLINDDKMRLEKAREAKQLALDYSWKSCSNKTWNYLVENI